MYYIYSDSHMPIGNSDIFSTGFSVGMDLSSEKGLGHAGNSMLRSGMMGRSMHMHMDDISDTMSVRSQDDTARYINHLKSH
jgi:hypothetical protein